jgi:histidinol-phosphate aminotransferase
MTWPDIRNDLKLVEGYHSPQLSVEVRLNTNESPLPPPNQWVSEIKEAVTSIEWNRYPDRNASELASRLAQSHGVQPSNVVCANGSNEIIQAILLAYGGNNRSAIMFEPTYAMHTQIAKITGTEVISRNRDELLRCGRNGLEMLTTAKPNIVFLCSPNNPTGLIEPKETIISALEYCSKNSSLLVVDEAYGEFSDWSAIELVDNGAPMVVTRTFSKAHGFAAGRLGYAVGASRLIDGMKEVLLPYHLDSFKQIAGITALKYRDEMRQRVEYLKSQREKVSDELKNLPLQVWDSAANFILFKPLETVDMSGNDLWKALVNDSVLVRDCSNWPNLTDCLRATIGTEQENNSFIDSLKAILG